MALDQKSDDFTHLTRRLLSDQGNHKSGIPQFTEEQALELIELVESTVGFTPYFAARELWSRFDLLQILQHPDIHGDLKSTAFTMLRRLCGTFGRLPRSYLIDEDFKLQETMPFATRGYTDLWKLEWSGRKIAVKALRFAPDDDRSKTTRVMGLFCGRSLGTHDQT